MCGTSRTPKTFRVLAAIFAVLALSACSGTKTVQVTGSCASRVAVTYSGPSERSYCTTTSTYPSGTTVSGAAYYKARTGTTNGLDGVSADRPIRFAEIEILDSNGARVQCAETAADGTFTALQVPIGTSPLTIRVNSRSNDENELQASVLNCPEENGLYAVQDTFIPSGPQTVTLSAGISGAFNILDQLYNANEFLRDRVGNCGGAPSTECTPITTSAPKVKAYWELGFNPNNYFGSTSPVSFYIPGTSRLFIMGGEGGDDASEDTDHFDNSVIIHEYGHFLEDIYSVTNSPGGSHSGNKVIDPRLAWSEGWGDFIQAAVQDVPYYYDTVGYGAGSTTTFAIPLESGTAAYTAYCPTANPTTSGCDKPQSTGEGNFREFSVTRMLWDISDGGTGNSDGNGDAVNNEFLSVWKALTSETGFLDPLEEYRAIGYIHDYDTNMLGGNWTSLRTTHKHGMTEDYAQYVEADGSCSGYNFTMSPITSSSDNGSFETSNLATNNDFYYYRHPGGTLKLKLTYETVNTTTGTESDLDLFVYNTMARFGNSADMKLTSQNYFDYNLATPEVEQASKSLPAGKYLINVKTYTGRNTSSAAIGPYAPNQYIDAGTTLHYKLEVGASLTQLCPAVKPWK